jgi:hypothetical protein
VDVLRGFEGMSHVVHINDGVEDIPPIVLRLLPGAEDILEITLVNQGQPSNVFVEASGSIKKAVRLKKTSYFVVQEELVPILVKMPKGASRLSGEILVDSDESISRIPLTLVSDADAEAPEDGDVQDDEYAEDEDEGGSDDEGVYSPVSDEEDEDEEEDLEPPPSQYRYTRVSQPDFKLRAPPIPAPKSSYRVKRAGPTSYADAYYGDPDDGRNSSPYIEPASYESSPEDDRRRDGEFDPEDSAYESTSYRQSTYGRTAYDSSAYERSDDPVPEEESSGQDGEAEGLGLPFVPLSMIVLLVAALVLTFYSGVIPEFPGALASSILIVTLIIYGAATLLKA